MSFSAFFLLAGDTNERFPSPPSFLYSGLCWQTVRRLAQCLAAWLHKCNISQNIVLNSFNFTLFSSWQTLTSCLPHLPSASPPILSLFYFGLDASSCRLYQPLFHNPDLSLFFPLASFFSSSLHSLIHASLFPSYPPPFLPGLLCLVSFKDLLNLRLFSSISSLQLYDLGSPADSQSSSPGCMTTDSSCVNMGFPSCGHHGRCHGEWGSFSCQCVPGYTGHQCEEGKRVFFCLFIFILLVFLKSTVQAYPCPSDHLKCKCWIYWIKKKSSGEKMQTLQTFFSFLRGFYFIIKKIHETAQEVNIAK